MRRTLPIAQPRPPRYSLSGDKRRLCTAIVCCLLWPVPLAAAEKTSSYNAALASIKAAGLGCDVDDLAGPAMEGREAGTRGGKAAGDYIVDHYQKLHLAGGADKGQFLQPFEPNFRNVLAILKGSDSKLRDQFVVVSAHYDHIGYGALGNCLDFPGQIHPGADDNASGSSAVLELAKAFTLLGQPPKRSILFINFDAEEKGLLGSKYWVAHPTVALDRVIAALNLDMIGRLRDKHILVVGSRSGCGWRRILSTHNEGDALSIDFAWRLRPEADYFPLFEHGIPVLLFHTGLHDDYHRATDLAKFINREGMEQITRMVFATLYDLANDAKSPAYRATARNETEEVEKALAAEDPKPAERLGVGWSEDAAASGGVLISDIKPDSPAEHAGLRPGDLLLRFAGRRISSDDDFYAAVSAADSPAVVVAERPDEPKPLRLKVTLDGKPLRWGIGWRVDDAEPGAVILTWIVPGSPAARAGLLVGDRIYQVAGRDFADSSQFALLANALADSVQLLVERSGRLRSVTIRFRHAEPFKQAA